MEHVSACMLFFQQLEVVKQHSPCLVFAYQNSSMQCVYEVFLLLCTWKPELPFAVRCSFAVLQAMCHDKRMHHKQLGPSCS